MPQAGAPDGGKSSHLQPHRRSRCPIVVHTLLVHGDLVWKSGLGAFVALVFWVVARVRRGRARRWAANLPSALDLHSDRVVRGVLGGGAARSLTRGDEHEDHRDPELWISTPDGRIPLAGPIHVLAGSTATAKREFVLHGLAAGDQVIAHGTLERRAGTADYRSDPTTFVLTGAPITMCARTPAIAVPRLKVTSIALILATSVSLGYIAERALGAGWRGACASAHADACVLAATMPGGDNAGRMLLAVLDVTHHNTRADVDHRVEIAELVGDCDYAMRPLEQAQLWDELLATARRCNSPVEQQLALAQLGRFAEAATFTPANPKVPRLELLILAHAWLAAGDELDKVARKESHASRRRTLHCRADLFRAWGGDDPANSHLGRYPATPADRAVPQYWGAADRTCETEAAMFGRSVDTWYEFGQSYGAGRLAEVYATLAALDDDAVAAWGSRFWTAKYAQTYGSETADTLAVLDARAIHRAMTGDIAGALTDAASNDELAHRVYYVEERAPLHRQLSLFTPATDIAHDLPTPDAAHDAWWHELAHVFLRDGLPYAQNLDHRTREALDAAQLLGDGRPLAARLADDHELRDLDIIAVLPRITRGRAALLDAIRAMVPEHDPLGLHGFPFVGATRAFTRRVVLELAGDPASAARWADIFRRYDRALDDPRTLVGLALATAT